MLWYSINTAFGVENEKILVPVSIECLLRRLETWEEEDGVISVEQIRWGRISIIRTNIIKLPRLLIRTVRFNHIQPKRRL